MRQARQTDSGLSGAFFSGTCRNAPERFKAVCLRVSVLIKGSGPKARVCLKSSPKLTGFSSRFRHRRSFPLSSQRKSQALATSPLSYFTEVKPMLKFHLQKCFLNHFSEEGSQPISEPLKGPGAASQEFSEPAAPKCCWVGVCACA